MMTPQILPPRLSPALTSRLALGLLLAAGLLAPGCGSDSSDNTATTSAGGTAGQGQAGSGQAGSGQAGSGQAGSGQAGSGQAGSGTAGSGTAGSGQAGSGNAGSGNAGSGGAAGEGGAGQAGAGGAVKRTVSQRAVLGHALPGNLIFDGDFELTRGQDKALSPWLGSDSTGQSIDVALETGGLCRSGLLCGRLKSNETGIALGASARGLGMDVSVQIRPLGAAPTCDKIAVGLVSCVSLFSGTSGQINLDLGLTAATPDAQGWCQFQGQIGPQIEGACLVVQNQTADDLLVDDAVVSASTAPPPPTALGSKAPSPRARRATEALQRALPALRARLQRAPEVGPKAQVRAPR
jgi:hypothetical protein